MYQCISISMCEECAEVRVRSCARVFPGDLPHCWRACVEHQTNVSPRGSDKPKTDFLQKKSERGDWGVRIQTPSLCPMGPKGSQFGPRRPPRRPNMASKMAVMTLGPLDNYFNMGPSRRCPFAGILMWSKRVAPCASTETARELPVSDDVEIPQVQDRDQDGSGWRHWHDHASAQSHDSFFGFARGRRGRSVN